MQDDQTPDQPRTALEGVRVMDLTPFILAPSATRTLCRDTEDTPGARLGPPE